MTHKIKTNKTTAKIIFKTYKMSDHNTLNISNKYIQLLKLAIKNNKRQDKHDQEQQQIKQIKKKKQGIP